MGRAHLCIRLLLLVTRPLQEIVKDKAGQTPLFSAISKKNMEMAKFLIAKNADVNVKADNGETPLTSAVSGNDLEMAKFLIANKADVNSVGKNGSTPLLRAVYENQPKFVELLLQSGANTESKIEDERTVKGWTPLHFAARYGANKELVGLL